uniref:TM2 domain containing 3 n=1 Tax=Amazona collaria TaxID=241587 RepID=A0A8B9GNL6_9PSIT
MVGEGGACLPFSSCRAELLRARPSAPPCPGGAGRRRRKMAAVMGLRALGRLCSVALFLFQLYVLSGRAGSLMTTKHSQPQSAFAKGLTSTSTNTPYFKEAESTEIPSYVTKCPSNGLCSRLPADCMTCNTNYSCIYGKLATFDCKVKPHVHCVDQNNHEQENFTVNMTCQFCWQLATTDYVCTNSTSCMTVSCPRQRYNATCTVRDNVHCLGNRVFPKMLYCNWTGGYKWSTALALRYTRTIG